MRTKLEQRASQASRKLATRPKLKPGAAGYPSATSILHLCKWADPFLDISPISKEIILKMGGTPLLSLNENAFVFHRSSEELLVDIRLDQQKIWVSRNDMRVEVPFGTAGELRSLLRGLGFSSF